MALDLMTSGDIAKLAKVKPATVRSWALRYKDFPKAATKSGNYSLWNRSDVDEWLEAREAAKAKPEEEADD